MYSFSCMGTCLHVIHLCLHTLVCLYIFCMHDCMFACALFTCTYACCCACMLLFHILTYVRTGLGATNGLVVRISNTKLHICFRQYAMDAQSLMGCCNLNSPVFYLYYSANSYFWSFSLPSSSPPCDLTYCFQT